MECLYDSDNGATTKSDNIYSFNDHFVSLISVDLNNNLDIYLIDLLR